MRTRTRTLIATACAACAITACSGGGGSGGGPKLALGTEAVLPFVSAASGSTPAVNTTVGVTVKDVRTGDLSDLSDAGFELDASDEGRVPNYVDVHYANKGTDPVNRTFTIGLEDSDGNSLPSTILLSLGGEPFDSCNHDTKGTVDPGKGYDDCEVFLVPKDTKVDRVRFVSQAPDNKITFTDWAPK
jgi:hypothetical protein